MPRTRREERDEPLTVARGLAPWAVALGLHLLAAAAIVVPARPHRAVVETAPPTAPSEIDVTVETTPAATETEPSAAAEPAGAVAARETGRALSTTPETRALANPNEPVAPAATNGEVMDSPAGTWAFRPTATADLRLGTVGAMAVAGPQHEPPRDSSGRPASTGSRSGGVVEALADRDTALGLGHGGPVRTAVDNAARTPDAPALGTATFAVTLGEGGAVSVSLMGATSERPAWDKLRGAIADAVAAAPKRLAVHGKGVRVVVQVEAKEQFASGNQPTPDAKQGAAVSGSIGAVTETKDHVAITPPHVALTYRTRNCGAGMVVVPNGVSLSGGCEAGVAMRVVSTKIMSEQHL